MGRTYVPGVTVRRTGLGVPPGCDRSGCDRPGHDKPGATGNRCNTRRGDGMADGTTTPATGDGTVRQDDVGAPAPSAMTQRQRQILDMIRRTVQERGYPPSVREIGEAVGLRSPSSVHSQLAALERGGHLRRDPSRPRAIEVRTPAERAAAAADLKLSAGSVAAGSSGPVEPIEAGQPIEPIEPMEPIEQGERTAPSHLVPQVEETYALPRDLVGEGTLFMLRVRGESMLQAGVLSGDLVVVRQQPDVEQGQMCAAMIDGEATVKFFRRTRAGEVFLDPANDGYEPIPVTREADAVVLGKVVAVLRSL